MLRISPFRALRPKPNLAARVASVPYDVVNTEEARDLAAGNPDSFLHVIRPEIDLPGETDPYDDRVYAGGRAALDRLIADGIMERDTEPGIYLYRQVMDHRTQIGVVCCSHIDDYAEGRIKKHEFTRPVKENDRTRHVLELDANAGPVFLTFRDDAAIAELMQKDLNQRPLVHFDAPDGVTHTVWRVRDPQAYVAAFGRLPASYVADGHHRAASAGRAGAERRAASPGHDGTEAFNWFLTVLFPAGDLTILPYHRVVKDLNGHDVAAVRAALSEVGTLEPTDEPVPPQRGAFGVYLDGQWMRLTLPPSSIDRSDPVGSLDCSLLQERVLTPILGIGDPRTDERVDFIGGIRGPGELSRRVDAGRDAIAFALHATSIEELLDVADADTVMPPKSTWFEPKLRSGLFVHRLDGRVT